VEHIFARGGTDAPLGLRDLYKGMGLHSAIEMVAAPRRNSAPGKAQEGTTGVQCLPFSEVKKEIPVSYVLVVSPCWS
jgi:hypothetical protein